VDGRLHPPHFAQDADAFLNGVLPLEVFTSHTAPKEGD
jgi:hypothetical protein